MPRCRCHFVPSVSEIASTLPYPALHASHAGIWIADARGDARGRARRGDPARGRHADDPAQRAAGRAAAGLCRTVGARPARAVRVPPPGALRCVPTPRGLARDASGWRRPSDDAEHRARSCATRPSALLAIADGDWPEREGAWTAAQIAARGCAGPGRRCSPIGSREPEQHERWLFSKLPEWEEAAPRPAPRTGHARRRARSPTASPA